MRRNVPRPDSRIQLISDVEGGDNRSCEVGLEERLDIWASTRGLLKIKLDTEVVHRKRITYVKSSVESRDHANNVECKPIPAAKNAKDSFIWKLGFNVALSLPCRSESNVGQADGSPNEEIRETG